MFVTWLAFSIPLVSAGFLRGFADDAVEMADDLPLLGGEACSFSADTPVATAAGQTAISDVAVGDQVLAWNEETNATGYYTVTATLAHADPVIVHLTIDGETIETTPEHSFYAVASAPWLAAGENQGRWTPAGDLKAGDHIQQADGTTGVVQTVVFEATPQVMYNLTVAAAHTFFVGDGEWLVHNASCPVDLFAFGNATKPRSPRPSDFGLDVPDLSQIILAQDPPAPHGASTFADALGAPVSGHYHLLPAGTELPNGIDIIADGSDVLPGSVMPPTHHTIYNTIQMTYGEFLQIFENLPWQYAGKKK